jgi:hypothetical protein
VLEEEQEAKTKTLKILKVIIGSFVSPSLVLTEIMLVPSNAARSLLW